MSIALIATIAILSFVILIVAEAPIGLALAAGGTIGIVLLDGVDIAGSTLAAIPFSATARYGLFVVPMFVLLGSIVANAGIGEQIFSAANRIVGRLPAGLAAATVLATTIFSGISGSSAADVATIGRVSVLQMRKHGYAAHYAAAVVAAAGAFAFLVPPSIVLVIYAIIAEESVGTMLLAGIIPGMISALALISAVVVRRILRPPVASVGASPDTDAASLEIASRDPVPPNSGSVPKFAGLVYAGLLFIVVAGGIYTGVFTATEAGAMGAFTAFVIVLLARQSRQTTLARLLGSSIREAADITSMIFLLLIGGAIFTVFVASANIPAQLTEWVVHLPVPPRVLVAIFLLAMLPLGMFLDGLSILLLTVPIAAPIVVGLGFDGVWFGILTVKMIEIGLITPPVGINVFIISGLVDDVPAESVFRSVLPFVVLDLAVTALLFAFPGIVTWLPNAAAR